MRLLVMLTMAILLMGVVSGETAAQAKTNDEIYLFTSFRGNGENGRHVTTSDKGTGPWKKTSEPFSPMGLWVEGATALKIGNNWYVYFDAYMTHSYGAIRTEDFKSWENVSEAVKVPKGMRHATVFSASHDILDKLLK